MGLRPRHANPSVPPARKPPGARACRETAEGERTMVVSKTRCRGQVSRVSETLDPLRPVGPGFAPPAPRPSARTEGLVCLALFAGLFAGCASTPTALDRSWVAATVHERTGRSMGPPPCRGDITLPPRVSGQGGLTEDEAVTVALWNNAAFQELLVDLGLTRADLIQAGLLPNPELWHLYP